MPGGSPERVGHSLASGQNSKAVVSLTSDLGRNERERSICFRTATTAILSEHDGQATLVITSRLLTDR